MIYPSRITLGNSDAQCDRIQKRVNYRGHPDRNSTGFYTISVNRYLFVSPGVLYFIGRTGGDKATTLNVKLNENRAGNNSYNDFFSYTRSHCTVRSLHIIYYDVRPKGPPQLEMPVIG